jgi:hypothetical protein
VSAQVVERVRVREILGAVAGTDELVPVRVMSSATSRFAQRDDSAGCGRRQQRTRAAGQKPPLRFAGRRRSLQDLGQDISPLFRAADRSRPNLGVGFRFGVEIFGQRTNR